MQSPGEMATSDDIGFRGEAIFSVLITAHRGRRPYFRPHFLGEKYATLDYLVELIGARRGTPYFFVQVRTTRLGYTRKERRLQVRTSADEVRRMARYPAPTYLVGIDERGECGYILSVSDPASAAAIPSLPTKHPLNADNLERLWDEVCAYWDARDMVLRDSVFSA